MPFKILLGAIIGGALMFGAGYVEHDQLKWMDRHTKGPKDVSSLINSLKTDCPEPGIYMFPRPPEDLAKKTPEEQKQAMENLASEINQGRYGFLLAPKSGLNMSFWDHLIYEGVSNVIACLIASLVVAMTRPSIGFFGRWLVVVFLGVFSWAAISASDFVWHHFPQEYVLDQLYCSALEAAAAGIAIAAIVVPRERMTAGF